jgi:hypothetical protein
MCAFGRLPESDREVIVLVVVDEPRGGKKYGADVAGRAAVSILKEALGLTRGGVPTVHDDAPGPFAPLGVEAAADPRATAPAGHSGHAPVRLPRTSDQPWAEDEHASR